VESNNQYHVEKTGLRKEIISSMKRCVADTLT